MDAHCESILREFRDNEKSYKLMRDLVIDLIKKGVAERNLTVAGIEARVKTAKSLEGKLERKGMKYRSISDITDILGARVITFYSDEIDTVAALIENLFDIDWENSVDKRKIYNYNTFGYMSLHYICRIPRRVFFDETRPEINETRFEIQMKTALQHVWATIEHDMGYKTDVEIPKEYSRRISRLAGLLEIADEEFKNFRQSIIEYRRNVLSLVKDGKFDDISLDGDSFKDYIAINPFKEILAKISSSIHAEIQEVSLIPYLAVLADLKINTLGDLERIKKEYFDEIVRLALYQLSGKDIDIISSTLPIHNLCIIHAIKIGGGELEIRRIYDTLYGERGRNAASAKRVFAQAAHLNITAKE